VKDLADIRWAVRQHWWIPPAALAVAVGACCAAAILAKPRYVRWRSARAVAQAREFLKANDLKRAGVALQVALRGEPTLDGLRALGDFDETVGSDQAVAARLRASQLSPNDTGLKLDLARTALRFDDLAAAREALASIGPADRPTLEYRRIEATYALLAGEWTQAARLLAEVKKEAPADAGVRLLDDSLNLRNADARTVEAARDDLRRLAGTPAQHLAAQRALLNDTFARHLPVAAGEIGRDLAAADGASFSDLLGAADAEIYAFPATGADPFLLARIRARASALPSVANQYGRWLLLRKGPEEVAAWLRQLPPDIATAPAIVELHAEVAAARGDWNSLRLQLKQGAWGPVLAPGLDLGFAARILRQRGDPDLAGQVWREALAESASSQASLRALARLADIWRWPDGMQSALFATLQGFPRDEVAAQRLIGLLRARRDSRGFLQLLALRKDLSPPSDRRLADWALLSLLVSPAEAPDSATRTLDELYARQPGDPYIATDHAFALWQLGRTREACLVLDRLTPDERRYPLRAPYLAVIFASAGRREDAKAALVRAPKPAVLLPEEVELLDRATAIALR
jgi:hypothetical protein